MSEKHRLRNLKQILALEPIVSESGHKPKKSRMATTSHSPIGEASATTSGTHRGRQPEPSRSPEAEVSTNIGGSSNSLGGSARRHGRSEYLWLRRTLKHQAVLYITKALEETRMSRTELAEKLGLSLGRVNQLLTIRGFGEYERVPLDLIYQIWNITKVPPTFLTRRFVPPAYLRKEPPSTH